METGSTGERLMTQRSDPRSLLLLRLLQSTSHNFGSTWVLLSGPSGPRFRVRKRLRLRGSLCWGRSSSVYGLWLTRDSLAELWRVVWNNGCKLNLLVRIGRENVWRWSKEVGKWSGLSSLFLGFWALSRWSITFYWHWVKGFQVFRWLLNWKWSL